MEAWLAAAESFILMRDLGIVVNTGGLPMPLPNFGRQFLNGRALWALGAPSPSTFPLDRHELLGREYPPPT